ncbi:MAG: MmcQ/YjbR family DNA-binding protein [Chloroflexi bacterium]|nr:MmcQ/YjbR family DNA-binding protein [Chloroflexota bacterium]
MPAPRTPATRPANASMAVLHERKARFAALGDGLPETVVSSPWGNEHLTLEVAGKRFGYYLSQHHGDDGRSGAVLKAAPGVQELLVEADPDRFWVPAFLGRHGWVGIRLDLEEPDWDELETLLRDAWRLAAPRRLRDADQAG